jgi:hypothetical protein
MYNDYLIKQDNIEEYRNLCQKILQYSDHSLIKLILTFFYEKATYEMSSEQKQILTNWINSQNVYSLKLEIQIIKFCHILLYILILYVLLQVIPPLIFNMLLYIAQNMFFIIFIALIIEAVLNLYLGIRLDMTKSLLFVKNLFDFYIRPLFK